MNGNWFGSSCVFHDGWSRSNGVTYGCGERDIRSAYLAIAGGRVEIDDFYTAGTAILPAWADHAVGGKQLLDSGTVPGWVFETDDPTFTVRQPRTAVGVTADGLIVLLTIDGRRVGPGATGVETAGLLAGLGAVDAVMLDGGGSTTMAVQGRVVNDPADGAPRAVANQLVFDAGPWID